MVEGAAPWGSPRSIDSVSPSENPHSARYGTITLVLFGIFLMANVASSLLIIPLLRDNSIS